MQVEPADQLAFALRSAPRLFACLIGSGASRAAGVPTGWEVVLDLVRRHAAQLDEKEREAARENPERWYRERYQTEPDYAEVVERLAPTTDLQRSLLAPYFVVRDPATGEEREHAPTAAHLAIAELVRKGYLRTIVTTNFDRLIESALKQAGLADVDVVSSAAEAETAPPFHASECFVFKLHGDWRDTTLRNSREALSAYPPELATLLQRVLDEHGLVVCGWSALYDTALQQALSKRKRRLPVYWIDPKPAEATLVRMRELGAVHVAMNADRFFERLELATAALERYHPPERMDADVLVLKAKRLIEAKRAMALDELVEDATRALCRWIEGELAPSAEPADPSTARLDRARALLEECERAATPLARLLITLGRYGAGAEAAGRSLSALLRAAKAATERQTRGEAPWPAFFGYPPVLAAYAYGVACGFRDDWRPAIVAARDAGSGESESELVLPPAIQDDLETLALPKYGDAPPPGLYFCNRIADWLAALASEWIPRRAQLDPVFDRFDVIVAVLSLRYGADWRPRCIVPVDASRRVADTRTRASFDDTFEYWFVNRVYRVNASPEIEEPLAEVLVGHPVGFDQIVERIRAWKNEPRG
jgi:hypothetical protein